MATMRIPPEQLRSTATSLQNTANNIQQQLGQAQKQVRACRSEWESSGAKSFETLMDKWNKLAKQQRENLEEISKHLRHVADVYQQQDDEVARSFKS